MIMIISSSFIVIILDKIQPGMCHFGYETAHLGLVKNLLLLNSDGQIIVHHHGQIAKGYIFPFQPRDVFFHHNPHNPRLL